MKKITLILFALISGTAFAQEHSVTGTATTFAEIVEPLTITNIGDSQLNFGRIVRTEAGGEVTIGATQAISRTFTNSNMKAASNDISPAIFEITGGAYRYTVVAEASTLTHDGSEAEGVDTAMELTVDPSFEGNTGEATLYVGGTLKVAGNQAAGAYTGDVTVTISYE